MSRDTAPNLVAWLSPRVVRGRYVEQARVVVGLQADRGGRPRLAGRKEDVGAQPHDQAVDVAARKVGGVLHQGLDSNRAGKEM